MITCSYCQSANPPGHKFCQSCGKPLQTAPSASGQIKSHVPLQATLTAADDENRQRSLTLSPGAYLDEAQRYEIVTVLNETTALVKDVDPQRRSPLQTQLSALEATLSPTSGAISGDISESIPIADLKAVPELPYVIYPYCVLAGAAPRVYDAWQQEATTVVVTYAEGSPLSSILQSFALAADALNHVYWLYSITELWLALEAIPEWRSSLLLADHLGIDDEQSVRIRCFAGPADPPPGFSQLKAFLKSLLAQPNQVADLPHPQIRETILTVSSAATLQQLRSELSDIGEVLLSTPKAITPFPSSVFHTPVSPTPTTPVSAPTMAENTPPTNSFPMNTPFDEASGKPLDAQQGIPTEKPATGEPEFEEIEFLGDAPDGGESTMVLPMKLVDIEEAGRTDVGRQRDHNEDCFFISTSTQKQADNNGKTTKAHSLYVLCDGMGGHDGGEVASHLAAETLSNYFNQHWPHPLPGQTMSPLPSEDTIATAVRLANQAIFDVNEKEGRAGHERMGTTLVMVLVQGAEAAVAHVGDSRLYQHARRSGLRQITTDHEVGQREIQRGVPHDVAYARPDAYQLTQALGPRSSEDLEPSVAYLSFSEDTLLLLCSDGLSDNNLVEDHVESHVDPMLRGGKDMDTGMDDLINLANEVNGHDNISAIAIRLKVSPDLSALRNKPTVDRGITILQ